jgi:acyl-CoA reductase-like NAD-dependent aldehyde dehydrogenase
VKPFRLLIGGVLCDSPQMMAVVNPANEEIAAQIPRGTPALLERCIAAAHHAMPAWASAPHAERATSLKAVARIIDENRQELGDLITLEQGKPRSHAELEIDWAVGACQYFAGITLEPQLLRDDRQQRIELFRRPVGLVAAIIPWNYPLMTAINKLAPALIAGNALLLKPSPTTPLTTLRLGELIRETVPTGVLSVISDGGDIGPLISAHPGVAKMAFTGSTASGKAVMRSAADTMKRVTLELGGNDAAIVLDDVDVKETAALLFACAFANSGQVCVNIKRIYVQAAIYDSMCSAIAELAKSAVLGDGADPKTQFGPLQNRKQFDAISRLLDAAPSYGKVIAGGRTRRPGYFVEPTVVRDIIEGNPLVDEEVFGPVRPIIRFDTIDEAVSRANRSQYGLGGSVWTRDIANGQRIAARLQCGTAWVNQHFSASYDVPCGGIKQSGIGVELSREGLLAYTDIQVINTLKT